jgi:YD repeat-containing protein
MAIIKILLKGQNMMNIFKCYKQAFSIVLLSLLFVGCSSKSSKSSLGTETTPTALDGNTTTAQDGNETSGLESEANICKNDEEKVISRAYTDLDGDGTIDSVRVYAYDKDGKILSIAVYAGVNGERDPENNGMTPVESVTYAYDDSGNKIGTTSIDKDGNEILNNLTEIIPEMPIAPSINTNLDADGSGNVTTTYKGTTRTFTYENKILVSGKAEYENGRIKEYTYGYDEKGNRISETVNHKDKDGNIVDTETITYDDNGNTVKVEHDTDGDGIADSSTTAEYEYTCI